MSVNDPTHVHQAWEKAFNGGDIDALVDLYEPDATLIPEPEKPVSGHAAIREALVPLHDLKGRIQLRTGRVIPSGDLAVVYADWSFVGGTDPDGNNVDLEGHSTELMRRQSDRSWLDVIEIRTAEAESPRHLTQTRSSSFGLTTGRVSRCRPHALTDEANDLPR